MSLIDADMLLSWFESWNDNDEFSVGYIKGLIKEAEKVGAWIPCTERLPETERHAFYLISSKGTSWIAKWNGEYWASIFFPFVEMEDVDAWAPMPEPWKGKE